jgi:hypothetical protein
VAKAAKKKANYQRRNTELTDSEYALNEQLSVEPYGMRFGDKTANWARKT